MVDGGRGEANNNIMCTPSKAHIGTHTHKKTMF